MESINLLELKNQEKAKITAFEGGRNLSIKLRQYGLFIGDQVHIIRTAPFNGPILIESGGREIALGKGIARKIMVKRN
ncbi:ferrous iron transport protein A [Chloroflexota bacterium]